MVTFQAAASEYLTTITPTHTPSTMRTYHRNFEVLLVPYFGADTPLAEIAGEQVAAFHASEALLQKPNGQPRAEPTKNQITGLLRSFLTHAATNGLMPAIADMPTRSRRVMVRLCDRCRAPLTDADASPATPPATAEPAPAPAIPAVTAPVTVTLAAKPTAKPQRTRTSTVQRKPTSEPTKQQAKRAGKRR
jgi:hypothetical protein